LESLTQPQDDDEASVWRPSRKSMVQAIEAYQQAIDLDAAQFWAHLQKGRCHFVREEMAEALAEFDLAIALRPDAPWAWSSISRSCRGRLVRRLQGWWVSCPEALIH